MHAVKHTKHTQELVQPLALALASLDVPPSSSQKDKHLPPPAHIAPQKAGWDLDRQHVAQGELAHVVEHIYARGSTAIQGPLD